jgi:molybdopterin molybdotransferase
LESARTDKGRTRIAEKIVSAQNQNTRAASAGEVIALVEEICQPLAAERVRLDAAIGRILCEPVRAPEDQPAFDRSAVDGFAIRLDDTNSTFQVVDEIRAGDWKPRALASGEAVRIATGGALPAADLQVVMKEDARLENKTLHIVERDSRRNIRFRGEDARAGQALVEPGTKLQSGALALLASVGHANPLVTRLPQVLHLATGNEIVAPEQTPQRGQIRDSNSILVRSFLAGWKITPEQARVPEDETAAQSAIASRQSAIDLLLISGGASVGEHDFTRRLLETFGFEILVSKTTMRPGKPLIVARRGNALAFGLPGNPLAHFVCLNLFVRVALEKFSGRAAENIFHRGALAAKLDSDSNARETFWPARHEWRDGKPQLTPLRWSSSGDLTSLASANALIRVAANCAGIPADAEVEFISTVS